VTTVVFSETEVGQMWTMGCDSAKAQLTSQLGTRPDS